MSWYAVESVDDAIDATRSFLFPVELSKWLKLALISIFVGVGGGGVSSISNISSIPSNTPSEPTQQPPTSPPTEQLPDVIPTDPVVVAAIVGAVVLLILGLTLLSETLRLVFYDALRTGTVRLRKPFGRRFGQAVRLFGFKLAVSVAFAIPFVVIGAAIAQTGFDLGGGPALMAGALLAGAIGVLSVVAYLIINRATNEFVAPVMVLTDSGVLDAWRRFWPVLRNNKAQFGVYVLAHFLLLLAISIGQSILGIIVFGIVGTVGALVGLLLVVGIFGGLSATLASTVGVVAVGVLVVLTVVAALVLYLPINVVVLTYVFSYELSVLGAVDEELQLLAEPSEDNTEPAPKSTV